MASSSSPTNNRPVYYVLAVHVSHSQPSPLEEQQRRSMNVATQFVLQQQQQQQLLQQQRTREAAMQLASLQQQNVLRSQAVTQYVVPDNLTPSLYIAPSLQPSAPGPNIVVLSVEEYRNLMANAPGLRGRVAVGRGHNPSSSQQ